MGYRQAAVLSSTCFFLGVLFVCLNIDYRILFTPLTDEAIQDGFEFYTTFYNSPTAIKALLHAIMGVGIIGIMGKLFKWDESAMFFDGSSLAAYIFAMSVYISVCIPSSRTVAVRDLPDVTHTDRIEALRVLSAGNTIMIVLLGAVLVLQAGEEYARRLEASAAASSKPQAGVQPTPAAPEGVKEESKKDK